MTEQELEFAIFCIENLAARLGINATKAYDMLTIQSRILDQYILPNYEVLHSQGKDYIVEDLLEIMKEDRLTV